MGTYKVPQNVEAEDKILGPLSIKQFIYAMIGIGWGFLTFAIFRQVIFIWVIIGLPPMLALLALGLYQKEDQPLETYVLAVAQYIFRPKQRKWIKEPIAEVFRVEPPPPKPQIAKRDPREVQSQLAQLAQLVDTRGWLPKQPELQEPDVVPVVDLQERLGVGAMTQPVTLPGSDTPLPVAEVTQADDMLNEEGQAAANLNILIENSVKNVREEALHKMDVPAPKPKPKGHSKKPAAEPKSTTVMTPPTSDAILKLAAEGGDLTVAQLAAQAARNTQAQPLAEGQSVQIRDGQTTAR